MEIVALHGSVAALSLIQASISYSPTTLVVDSLPPISPTPPPHSIPHTPFPYYYLSWLSSLLIIQLNACPISFRQSSVPPAHSQSLLINLVTTSVHPPQTLPAIPNPFYHHSRCRLPRDLLRTRLHVVRLPCSFPGDVHPSPRIREVPVQRHRYPEAFQVVHLQEMVLVAQRHLSIVIPCLSLLVLLLVPKRKDRS